MNVNDLPIEILQKIFKNVIGQDLLKCRGICQRWRLAIDGLSDEFWKKICKEGFKYMHLYTPEEVYEEIYRKANLSWRELYITLDLWGKVKTADFQVFELPETVFDFQSVADGIIGYPCRCNNDYPMYCTNYDTIVYYDLTTMQEQHRTSFDVPFTDYAENDKLKLVVNVSKLIDVTIKSTNTHYYLNDFGFLIKLLNNKFYYQTSDKFYCAELVEQDGEVFLCSTEIIGDPFSDWKYIEDITSINGEVYVRTRKHMIYLIVDNKLQCPCPFYNCENSLDILRHYGFKWNARDISYHMRQHLGEYHTARHMPNSLFTTDINAAWVFSEVIIIATPAPYRKLLVYYNPYSSMELALFNAVPDISVDLDAFGIGDRHRKPPVKKIDVVETVYGHNIIVLCGGAVYVIYLNHLNSFFID